MGELLVIGACIVLLLAGLNILCAVLGLFPSKWADRLVERRKRGGPE